MGLCFWGARLRFARVWTGESTGDFPERDFAGAWWSEGDSGAIRFPD